MNDRGFTDGVSSKPILATEVFKWEWFALFYARFALGAAFLSVGLCREAATYYSQGFSKLGSKECVCIKDQWFGRYSPSRPD
jgi:hypothetical protein